MTDEHSPLPLEPITPSGARSPARTSASATAFVAAMTGRIRAWHEWFRGTADEVVTHGDNSANHIFDNGDIEAVEVSIRLRYADAALHWNHLNSRARSHGIAFSLTAQAHHRAALLDALDNPFAPTLLTHRQLTIVQPVDDDGYPDTSPAHPAARVLHGLMSRQHPTLYPPERNDWTGAQWREHEQRQYAEWLAKCSPAARVKLNKWATRVNAELDAGSGKTSWRAPGNHGPRRRPDLTPA